MANEITGPALPPGLNAANTVPVAPAAAAPAAPAPAAAAAPPVPAPAPAIKADENQVTVGGFGAGVSADGFADIDNVNLDNAELRALDNLMQTYLADGKFTEAEKKTYQEIRSLFAGPGAPGGHGSEDAPAVQGPAGAESPAPTDPVAGTGPNSPSWDHGQAVVEGKRFSSVGDPHETTGDGGKFDNMKEGNFVKARSASGDFELQTVQGKDKSGRWPNATVNHAAAVKSGNDTVAYNGLDKTLTVNGEKKELKDGETLNLPDGGKVTKTPEGLQIVSKAGDTVNIKQQDNYIDVSGEIGPDRKDGEVRGSLGNFDADKDASNDLVGRDGTVMGDPKDAAAVDKFIEEWRAKPEENLFGDDPIGGTGPGTGDTAEAKADKEAFKQLDINEDNMLDGNELDEATKKYDINNDGGVDLMEFLKGRDGDRKAQGGDAAGAAPPKPAVDDAAIEAEFKARDITGNGTLTGTEIPADFKAANPNATKVTLEEYKAFRQKQEAEAPAADKAEFQKADLNEDGTLDGNEVGNWAAFDANKDGEVSEDEALKGKADKRAADRAAELAAFLKQIEERRAAAAAPAAPAAADPAAAAPAAAAPVAEVPVQQA
ncbi:MAG: hypothetical protein VKQ33_11945 [Candidatus Sericytochromatia bacterium]|nr:hypothetical protein [Candidatus Sericytochromatia bacterium]